MNWALSFLFSPVSFLIFIEICFTYHTVHPLKGKILWFLIYLQLFTQHSCDLRGISQRKEGQKRNSFSIYVQVHIVIILPDIPKACSFGVAKSSTLHRNGRRWEGKESKFIYGSRSKATIRLYPMGTKKVRICPVILDKYKI